MAFSTSKVAKEERFEAPSALDRKAQLIADAIRDSRHLIAFTGAGISTSAGIPDFRGPEGHWTLAAQGRQRTQPAVETEKALPTPSHMALVELQNRGLLKCLVSQNCDGLHRRSGIRADIIAELHGNSNREYCRTCGKEYIRDFHAVAPDNLPLHDHRTGRKCMLCASPLLDSLVHFGESLPAVPLERAFEHAKRADLCLVLGSSLSVTPSNEIPEIVGRRKGSKLVICNLQDTDLDGLADVRVFCRSDDLMARIMTKLHYQVPDFILQRHLRVDVEGSEGERQQIRVTGVDADGTPMSFLKSVAVPSRRRIVRTEPFVIQLRGVLQQRLELQLRLEFMGHYNEPDLDVVYVCSDDDDTGRRTSYLLEYNPRTGLWRTTSSRQSAPAS